MAAMRTTLVAAALALILSFGTAHAGEADVIAVQWNSHNDGIWEFYVTIRSNDTGWDAYADRFEILAPDGTVLGTRVLQHPHVDEQPFSRSLSGVVIPAGIDRVTVRAHHSLAGYDGETLEVRLP